MRGIRSRHGFRRTVVRTVQGVLFTFSDREKKRFKHLFRKVKKIALEEPSEWHEVEVGEEIAEAVTGDEARGVGFYREAILVNDVEIREEWQWVKTIGRLVKQVLRHVKGELRL